MIFQHLTAAPTRILSDIRELGSKLGRFAAKQRQSLITRILIFSIGVVLFGLVLRLAVWLPIFKEQVESISASRQLSIAQYVADDVAASLEQRVKFIDGLSKSFPPALIANPKQTEAWLAERHTVFPIFSRGLMVIPVSSALNAVDYPVLSGRRDLDFSHARWFVDAISTKSTIVGEPIRSRVDNEPVLTISAPIFDAEGKPIAVLVGVASLTAPGFLDLLQKTHIGENGGFLLMSPKDNMFLAATDSQKVFTPLPPHGANPLHDRVMAGFRGVGTTVNIHGVEELSAIVSVGGTDWILIARVPTAEVFLPVDNVRTYILRNTLGIGTVVIVIVVWVMRHFLKPLQLTSRQIHRMAVGEIELQPVPILKRDEVGELATGFNFLLSRLEEITMQKVTSERDRVQEKERIEALLRQWMADTSHELRTPIAVLRAQIEAIQDGVHEANQKTMDVLHREVVGLSRLVDDLHTLALSDVDQFKGQCVPISPLSVLDDVVQAFQDRYAAAGLRIQSVLNAVPGPLALIDPSHLRRVFSNLLENTLRYTDSGGELRISAIADGGVLYLHFDDTAPAVPEEALPRLFERFYRVDASRNRDFGGSGIGLAVCQAIIQAYGGSISAHLSPMGGLTFIVQLPMLIGE